MMSYTAWLTPSLTSWMVDDTRQKYCNNEWQIGDYFFLFEYIPGSWLSLGSGYVSVTITVWYLLLKKLWRRDIHFLSYKSSCVGVVCDVAAWRVALTWIDEKTYSITQSLGVLLDLHSLKWEPDLVHVHGGRGSVSYNKHLPHRAPV